MFDSNDNSNKIIIIIIILVVVVADAREAIGGRALAFLLG